MVLAAVGQICSTANLAHNLAQCRTIVQKAVAAKAKILFLPEASDYLGHNPSESLSLCQPAKTSPFVLGLQSLATQHSLPINVGIHEPSSSPSKLRNTLIHISSSGEITQRYQKLHLFDMDLSSRDGPKMQESASTERGDAIIPPFDSPIGKLGMAICFDLRFPELALSLRRQGAQIILYPSAFAVKTGRVHWKPLLVARAIETQCYVIASAQVGAHNEKRSSYGHSLVVSPWGEVVAELGGVEEFEAKGDKWEPEVAVVDIDLKEVEEVRDGMPLNRRTDVYSEV